MICPNCSKEINPRGTYCVHCGYRLKPTARENHPKHNYGMYNQRYNVVPNQSNSQNPNYRNNAAEFSTVPGKDKTNLVLAIVIPSVVVLVVLVLVITISLSGNRDLETLHADSGIRPSENVSEAITEPESEAFVPFEDSDIGKLLVSRKWTSITTMIDTYGEVIEYSEFLNDGTMTNTTEYMEGDPDIGDGEVIDYVDQQATFQVNEVNETVEYTFQISSIDPEIVISTDDSGMISIWMDSSDVESENDSDNIFSFLQDTTWSSPSMATMDSAAYIEFAYPDDGITISGTYYDGFSESHIYGYCITEDIFYVTYGDFSSIVILHQGGDAVYAYTYSGSGYYKLTEEKWTLQS